MWVWIVEMEEEREVWRQRVWRIEGKGGGRVRLVWMMFG